MQFDKPQKFRDKEHIIRGDEKEAAFSKGQTLKIELVNSESIDTRSALKILVEKAKILKGKAMRIGSENIVERRYYDHFFSWSEVNRHRSFGKF